MASLEKRNDKFRIKLRYGGRRFSIALKTTERKEAEALLGKLEFNLALFGRGHLDLPDDANLARFLISDGKLTAKPTVTPTIQLAELPPL